MKILVFNKKNELVIAGISGFLAVALGAFGAHSLKNILDENMLEIYKTGVLYHLIHSVVLLALSLSDKYNTAKSFFLFVIGIFIFSFSLYLYALFQVKFFAMLTPFGGLSLLTGWFFLIIAPNTSK